MNKTYLLAGLGIGILALSAASAYAANNSYEAFRAMMGDKGGRAAGSVNEQNFEQFNQMHRLMADGKYDEARKIGQELGMMGQRRGGSSIGGCPMHNGNGNGAPTGNCPMRKDGAGRGAGFVDKNNNGICDFHENIK